jgi:hypothetical protein
VRLLAERVRDGRMGGAAAAGFPSAPAPVPASTAQLQQPQQQQLAPGRSGMVVGMALWACGVVDHQDRGAMDTLFRCDRGAVISLTITPALTPTVTLDLMPTLTPELSHQLPLLLSQKLSAGAGMTVADCAAPRPIAHHTCSHTSCHTYYHTYPHTPAVTPACPGTCGPSPPQSSCPVAREPRCTLRTSWPCCRTGSSCSPQNAVQAVPAEAEGQR